MIITLLIIMLFVGLGVIFSKGKGSSLIAGFNTLSAEEKEQYNVTALCKFMGKMMFALSFSMLFWVLSEAYDMNWLFYTGLILFLAIVAFMVMITNTGNRFKK